MRTKSFPSSSLAINRIATSPLPPPADSKDKSTLSYTARSDPQPIPTNPHLRNDHSPTYFDVRASSHASGRHLSIQYIYFASARVPLDLNRTKQATIANESYLSTTTLLSRLTPTRSPIIHLIILLQRSLHSATLPCWFSSRRREALDSLED